MEYMMIENLILLVMLGAVVFGLSVLKRKLMAFAEELSQKALPVCCPVADAQAEGY